MKITTGAGGFGGLTVFQSDCIEAREWLPTHSVG